MNEIKPHVLVNLDKTVYKMFEKKLPENKICKMKINRLKNNYQMTIIILR